MAALEAERFAIPGLLLLRSFVFRDARGDLIELYQESAYRDTGITDRFVQDNVSTSPRGTLRGLHLQVPPAAQAKLVRVLSGAIYDVVVDLRAGSPTYLSWHALTLDDPTMTLYIPRGCAHGFQVVSDQATVVYKLSAEYAPQHELGIVWDDSQLGIEWPISRPQMSDRDRALPDLEHFLAQLAPNWHAST